MNTNMILSILRGETPGLNLNSGIEEDDLLANTFFDLPNIEQAPFWMNLSEAIKMLVAGNEGMSVYLAARFIYRMGEIKPPRLPRKKTLFDFLLEAQLHDMPTPQLASILLILLVLKRGDSSFWEKQISASLDSLEITQGDTYSMTAVVYSFLGLNRKGTVKAEYWARLFMTLNSLPSLPRMELLELLVGAEKETQTPEILSEELDCGFNEMLVSTKGKEADRLNPSIHSVFQAWLDLNQPNPAIAAWLNRIRKEVSPFQPLLFSPRKFYERSLIPLQAAA